MLQIKNIEFSYPQQAQLFELDDLRLDAGELIALIGLNGSGKSSLIRSIAGIEKPLKGEILIEGQKVEDINAKELATKLSLVLTDSPYPYQMLLEEFVAFGRYPFTNWLAKRSEEDKMAIERALNACNLTTMRQKLMGELSDGERQRAYLARALAQETPMVILDEPTTHLDGVNTLNTLKLLKEQCKVSNKGILFSTHRLFECMQLVDKFWLISNKKVLEKSREELGEDKLLQKELFGEGFSYDPKAGTFRFDRT